MQPVVRSVNVGGARSGIRPRGGDTAIDKRPVAAIEVRDPGPRRGGLGSGVLGDDVVSRKHHGGSRQAVYAVAREELDWWGVELGRDLRDGVFGENVTTAGLDVDGAVVGERWQIGSALLEVAGPRIPCATFAAWMAERGWVRRFTERGRTGAYLAVLEPGVLAAGDVVEVVERPHHGITVPEVFRAFMGDDELAARVLAAGVLGPEDQRDLERRRLTRRSQIDQ
ncbi:MAG TPA: MOSC domain-containing protein [Ornithinibacter sp.]|nr:MOSC domain-containing protein [Ornithinibacter sp.]